MEVPVFMTCKVAHKDTPAQQNAKRKAPSKTLHAFSSPDVFPYCQLKKRNYKGCRELVHQTDYHTVINKYCLKTSSPMC